ncbi:TetR family transcriptional regulator [Actinomadura rugatobispora]|uniref:TetR family transcriptional regulator n=1 Tax=Actinomadura rugatobispora TaxID=1994 RepID=A0ABW0ZQT1_9ACTN
MTEQLPVGAAVRRAREAQGLSLRALASRVGVSPATMSAIEHGRTPLTVTRLQRIAELLDVPAATLLRGETPASTRAADEPGDWRHYDELALGPILEAALRLFVRTGFHATSMREIAAESGVSVAGIYHHHAAKQEILVRLLEATMAEIGWRVRAARDDGGTPRDAFAKMVESLALFHALRGDLAFLGATEMRGITGPDLVRITAMRDEVQHLLDAQAARAFPGAEIRTACRAIATMCTSLPSWFRLDGPMSAEQVAKEYARYALAMLHRDPAR